MGHQRISLPSRIVVGEHSRNLPPEPRGRGGGTGLLVGDQPPLDVDALLSMTAQRQRRGSAAGASNTSAKDSPTIEGAPQVRMQSLPIEISHKAALWVGL